MAADMDMEKHEKHLKWLSVGFYVWGGLIALFSLFPLIHIGLGVMTLMNPEAMGTCNGGPCTDEERQIFGWVFIGIGVTVILIGMSVAAATLLVGRFIAQRKHPMFCMVIAGLNCLSIPIGLGLGICTILKLNKPEVKALFVKK